MLCILIKIGTNARISKKYIKSFPFLYLACPLACSRELALYENGIQRTGFERIEERQRILEFCFLLNRVKCAFFRKTRRPLRDCSFRIMFGRRHDNLIESATSAPEFSYFQPHISISCVSYSMSFLHSFVDMSAVAAPRLESYIFAIQNESLPENIVLSQDDNHAPTK